MKQKLSKPLQHSRELTNKQEKAEKAKQSSGNAKDANEKLTMTLPTSLLKV